MVMLVELLAQASQTSQSPSAGGSPHLMIGLMLAVIVFIFMSSSGRKKERKRYEQMLNSLKRNDRIQTIGGVIGTVVEVRDNDVLVKVDENNNVKMRFNRQAVKEVLQDTPTTESK